jgi:hypothetical protein
MKNLVVIRTLAADPDNGDSPLAISHSNWSASINLEAMTLILTVAGNGKYRGQRVKRDLRAGDACLMLIDQAEELDFFATMGRIALTSFAAHALASGAQKHHSTKPFDPNVLDYVPGETHDNSFAKVATGAALMDLRAAGAVNRSIFTAKIVFADTTVVGFQATEEEIDELTKALPFDVETIERFEKLFQLLDRRVEDGPRSLAELDQEVVVLESDRVELTRQLELGKTFEERDRIRQEIAGINNLINSKTSLRVVTNLELKYQLAEKENRLDVPAQLPEVHDQAVTYADPAASQTNNARRWGIGSKLGMGVGVLLITLGLFNWLTPGRSAVAPTAIRFPDFPSSTTIEELRAARALKGVNYDPWIVSLQKAYDNVDEVKLILSQLESMGAPVFIGHFTMPGKQKTTVYAGPYSSKEEAVTACQTMKHLGGGACKMNIGTLSAFDANN